MKRRIDQLRGEQFEYELPTLTFSQEKLEIEAKAGEEAAGSFEIENSEARKIRGVLYSSNARVKCEPKEFNGRKLYISYQADTTGMLPGEEISGCFTVCASIGEYELPYRIKISQIQEENQEEYTKSLEAFAEMAKKDFQKAYLFFIKFDFEKMLKKSAPEYVTLYEGIRRISVSYRSMEEFLVACKKKEPISIRIRESRAKFEELEDSVKESIVIVKNQWGFQRLDISADAEFIRLERNVVTTDEFIGNYYQLDYIIEEEKLHAGKNYASIRIRTGSQELRRSARL